MTTDKKERERLKEAMMACHAITPERQRVIAEIVKNQLGTDERKPEEKVGKWPAPSREGVQVYTFANGRQREGKG